MLNYHELSKELQKEIIRDRQVGGKIPMHVRMNR